MAEIDPRIVRVGIEIDGAINYYEKLAISASGIKFANPNQGECNIDIFNLSKDVRHYILKEASPFNRNRTPKRITLEVGRESYGTSLIYTGDIYRATETQPPDIGLSLRCLTGSFNKGEVISKTAAPITNLSAIAATVAQENDLTLQFLIPDKKISSYSFSGSKTGMIENLADLAMADVFVDAGNLVVKGRGEPVPGAIKLISKSSGMIGDPEGTEHGCKVTMLYDPAVKIGGQFRLQTEVNPELSGDYSIYKLSYHFTNRDVPFYYIAEANRL